MELMKKLHLENVLSGKMIFGGTQSHMYHLVTQSPWPLFASMGALMLTMGGVMTFHWYDNGKKMLLLGLMMIMTMMYVWWSDMMSEATYLGYHTKEVLTGLQMGMILFMASEMMFFFYFFWVFFHLSLPSNIILWFICFFIMSKVYFMIDYYFISMFMFNNLSMKYYDKKKL